MTFQLDADPGPTTQRAVSLRWGGHLLRLLPGRAAWLPERQMLLVADAHIGKAVSFRQLGVPVPRGTTTGTLERLSGLLHLCSAQTLVFLGDFLHSSRSHAPATQAAVLRWRQRHAGVAMTLVRSNHDDRAGDPPAALGFTVFDEPWLLPAPSLQVAGEPGLALCHHPRPIAGAAVLAGHEHPCVHVRGSARDHLRLPCFHFRGQVGVLPAFGSFTGMHPVDRGPGDQVFAVADDRVVALLN